MEEDEGEGDDDGEEDDFDHVEFGYCKSWLIWNKIFLTHKQKLEEIIWTFDTFEFNKISQNGFSRYCKILKILNLKENHLSVIS